MGQAAGFGRSTRRHPAAAGREAAKQAIDELGRAPALMIVFATTGYDQQALLDGVTEVSGAAPLVGCSGEGIISRFGAEEGSHTVCVLAIEAPGVKFTTLSVPGAGRDPAAAGQYLAARANEIADARLLLVMPDGMRFDTGPLLEMLNADLRPGILCAGGSAGAMFGVIDEQMRTFQYHDGQVLTESVSAVVVAGEVEPELTVSHGCAPIGLERVITRSQGPWVQQIDGRPAFECFQEYFDGEIVDLSSLQLVHICVGIPIAPADAGYGKHVLRAAMGLDKETGAMFFAGGGLETGTRVSMMRRDPVRIRERTAASGRELAGRRPGQQPMLVLQFDCAGRGRILFGPDATRSTVEPLRAAFAPEVPWLGLHTHGEIAPLGPRTMHHTYAVAVCALYAPDRAR
jgi:small ligand-binding sensory domain FIST